MKIRTIVNLTEAQKARIVSRNEPFPQRICTFEMSPEKAEIISRLKGSYKVTREIGLGDPSEDCVVIHATDDMYEYQRLGVEKTDGYDQNGNWRQEIQESIKLMDILAEACADGTIKEGSNIDFTLDFMESALQRREAILQQNEEVRAENARREELERPAKEAQARKEAQEKAERERIEAEKKARKDAEDRARNEATEAEKKAWIEEHGSERLQKGYAGGYRCQKLYEIERAQSILGSDYIRISTDGEEKDRSCPSLEALQEVDRLRSVIEKGAAIVWLPHGISGEEEGGCEAVKADPGKFSQHYFYKV